MKKLAIILIVVAGMFVFPAQTSKAWNIEKMIHQEQAKHKVYWIDKPLYMPGETQAEIINL